MRQKTSRGFTIPELIITMGVAAIILSTAVPGVSTTIKNNRLATQVNYIITDLHFARSEAAKRDVRVILCRSRIPMQASQHAVTIRQRIYNLDRGYLIFADDGKATNSTYDEAAISCYAAGNPHHPASECSPTRPGTNTWNSIPAGPSMKVEPPSCRSVTIAGKTMAGRSWSHSAASPGCTATISRPVNRLLYKTVFTAETPRTQSLS